MDRSPSAENRAPYSNDLGRTNRKSPMKSQNLNSDVERRFSAGGNTKSVLYSPEVAYMRDKEGRRQSSVSPKKHIPRQSPAKKEKSQVEEVIFQERKKLESIPRQHQQEYLNLLASESSRKKSQKMKDSSSKTDITFLGSKSTAIPMSESELCDEYKEILKKLEHVARDREQHEPVHASPNIGIETDVINLNISSIEKETELAERRLKEKNTFPFTLLDDAGYAVPQRVEDREKSIGLSDDFRSPFDSPSKLNDSSTTPINRSSPDEQFFTPMVDRKKQIDHVRPGDRNLINHQVEKVTNTLKRMTDDDKNELTTATWRSPQKKMQNEVKIPDFDSYRQSMPHGLQRNTSEPRISLQHVPRDQVGSFDSISEISEKEMNTSNPILPTEQEKDVDLIRPESYGASLSVHMNYSAQLERMEKQLAEAEVLNASYQNFKENQMKQNETVNKSELKNTEKNENQDIDDLLDGIELFESTLIEPVLVPKRRVLKPAPLTSINEDTEAKTVVGGGSRTAARAEAGTFRKNSAPIRNAVEKYCSDVKTLEKLELKKLLVYKKLGMCATELRTMEADIKVFTECMITDAQMWMKNGVGKEFIDQRCKQLAKMYSKVSVEIKLLASLLSKQYESGRRISSQELAKTVKAFSEPHKNEVKHVAVGNDSVMNSPVETEAPEHITKEIKKEVVEETSDSESSSIPIGNHEAVSPTDENIEIDFSSKVKTNHSYDSSKELMDENLGDVEKEYTDSLPVEEVVAEEHLPTSDDVDLQPSMNEPFNESEVADVPSSPLDEVNKNDHSEPDLSQLNVSSSRPPSVVPPLNLSSLLNDSAVEAVQADNEKVNNSTRRDSLISLNESELSSRLNVSERSESQRKNKSERFMTVSPKSSPQVPSRQFPVFSLDFTFNDSRLFNDVLSPSKFDNAEKDKSKEEVHEETPKKLESEYVNTPQPKLSYQKASSLFPEFTLNDSSEEFDDFLGVCSNPKTTSHPLTSPSGIPTTFSDNITETTNENTDNETAMKLIRSEEWTKNTMNELCSLVFEHKSSPSFEGFEEVDVIESLDRLKAALPVKVFSTDKRLQEMHDELRILFYASVLNVAADLWPKKNQHGLFGYPKPSLYCTDKSPESVTLSDFVQACLNRIVKPKDLYPSSGRVFKNDCDPEKLALQLVYCDRGFMDQSISNRIQELEEKVVDSVTDAVEAEITNSLLRDDREDQSTSLFGSFNSSFFSQGLMEGRFSIGRRSSITRESLSKRTPSPLVLSKIEE
ncbi:unnamed protein product [Auanema sp. JU1783]|nr:unnamed protein product [Auanema sp. JU1783]